MKTKLVLTLLLFLAPALALTQGFDQNYEVRKGDINGDGLTDLYIRQKPQIVILHGDIATPIVLPPSEPEYVVTQNSNKTFTFVEDPAMSGVDWKLSAVEVTALDFNADGSTDFFLKGVGALVQGEDGVSGVKDQLLFSDQDRIAKIRQIDSAFKQFFEEVYHWRMNQNYFIENAQYSAVTKTWTEYDFLGFTGSPAQIPIVCNNYPKCLYAEGYILAILFPYSEYDENKVYWFGEWYIYETRQVADYSAFNPLAVRYSSIYGEILERGELAAGSSTAIELSDILGELFGIQYMEGVLENPGEVLPEEEGLGLERIRWLRLIGWANVFSWTIELTGSSPRDRPLFRIVGDAELQTVKSNHAFSPQNLEVVQFWGNIMHADWWATVGAVDVAHAIGEPVKRRTMLEIWVDDATISAATLTNEPGNGGMTVFNYSPHDGSLNLLNVDIANKTIREKRVYPGE